MSETIDADAMIVRVTMNPRLWRTAFDQSTLYLVWCVAATFAFAGLAFSQPDSARVLAACALIVAWCGWTGWRTFRSARRLHRVLSAGVPALRLDALGLHVRDVPRHLDGAALAWSDCAAVVISVSPKGREWAVRPHRYVQFLPVSDDRVIAPGRRISSRDARVELLGLSAAAASVTWLELPGVRPDADDVVAWLRLHRPSTKVVGAGYSVTEE